MQQCTSHNVVRCRYSNVSRSPVVRVVDVLVPKSRLMTNSLFLTTRNRDVCNTKVVARYYPRPILWQLPRHKKRQNTQHEPQCWKCTDSRHVESEGCVQDVQSMYVYNRSRHMEQHCSVDVRVPSTFKSSLLMFVVYPLQPVHVSSKTETERQRSISNAVHSSTKRQTVPSLYLW